MTAGKLNKPWTIFISRLLSSIQSFETYDARSSDRSTFTLFIRDNLFRDSQCAIGLRTPVAFQ